MTNADIRKEYHVQVSSEDPSDVVDQIKVPGKGAKIMSPGDGIVGAVAR